jgi:hypothetical protein
VQSSREIASKGVGVGMGVGVVWVCGCVRVHRAHPGSGNAVTSTSHLHQPAKDACTER